MKVLWKVKCQKKFVLLNNCRNKPGFWQLIWSFFLTFVTFDNLLIIFSCFDIFRWYFIKLCWFEEVALCEEWVHKFICNFSQVCIVGLGQGIVWPSHYTTILSTNVAPMHTGKNMADMKPWIVRPSNLLSHSAVGCPMLWFWGGLLQCHSYTSIMSSKALLAYIPLKYVSWNSFFSGLNKICIHFRYV